MAAVAFAFWRTGALAAWYELAVLFNAEMYGQDQTLADVTRGLLGMVPSWRWYLALGALGAWFWRRNRRDSLVGLVLACIVVTSVASAYIQGKGFGYHIAGLLPPLAAFGACFIARSIGELRSRFTWLRLGVAVAACGVAAGGAGWKIWSQRRFQLEYYAGVRSEQRMLAEYAAGPMGFSVADAVEAAAYARRTTSPDATVLTWSRALHVNFLAGRASPSRFPTVLMLELAREPFSRARAWAEEFEEVLSSRPPTLILVPASGVGGAASSAGGAHPTSRAAEALRRALEGRYAFERSFGEMNIYRLRD